MGQNKLQENQLHKRFQENNLLLKKLLENQLPLPLVLRNHTDSNQEQLPSEKSENIKSQLISSSENSHSKEWSDRSPMNGNKNSDSNHQLFWLSKNQLKHISSHSLKTPTCVLFMLKELPSRLEIFNWQKELEETDSDFEYPLFAV